MRGIETVRIPNGADLLSTSNLLTFSHQDPVQMSVQRIRILHLAVLHKSMANHDYVTPGAAEIARQGHHSIPDYVNGITKICAAASLPDPILAQVAVSCKPARDAIALRVGSTDREIKTVCQTSESRVGVGLCERGDQCYYGRGEQLFAHGGCY